MGTLTGDIIKTLRPASRSGDQYGPCEECGKPMVVAFVAQSRPVYRRENDELYSSPYRGGLYGHDSCLQKFGPFTTDNGKTESIQ
jgi:hypothetical protein